MSKGKLIIIESGTDASGKATQAALLYERLVRMGKNVKRIEFPNYKSESSALVKMYLRGEFGEKADDVSPYIASSFYAVDRYASYMTEWKDFYENGGIIIADRYVSSNMVHQASKLKPEERDKFIDWLEEYEFGFYGIPKPDLTLFLDVPLEVSEKLMRDRRNKITNEKEKDIHERDLEYLRRTYENALYIAEKYKWHRIECTVGDSMRPIEDINNDIMDMVTGFIGE